MLFENIFQFLRVSRSSTFYKLVHHTWFLVRFIVFLTRYDVTDIVCFHFNVPGSKVNDDLVGTASSGTLLSNVSSDLVSRNFFTKLKLLCESILCTYNKKMEEVKSRKSQRGVRFLLGTVFVFMFEQLHYIQ